MTTAELLMLLGGSEASPELWAELVRRYGTRLWAVCRAVAGEQLADDAFQNGLITIRRRASRFRPGVDPEASALGWMVTVVHHAAIDLIRSERRRTTREGARMAQEPSATPDTTTADADDPGATRLALQALAALPQRHQEVIRLRLLGDLDARQTAAVLGCPPEQVRVRLARALQLLRDRCAVPGGALSVTALADRIHLAAFPPPTLPATAAHIATQAYSLPLAASLSLGAVMTISSIALGVVATASLILVATVHPGAMTAATTVDQPPVAVSVTPPAAGSDPLREAQDILALPELRAVIACGVRHLAEAQGVHGGDEAMARSALAAINGDHVLWQGYAGVMAEFADAQSLQALHAYLLTPEGRDYLAMDLHLQETINAPEMQQGFATVMQAADSILLSPGAQVTPGKPIEPALGTARVLVEASGYDAIIEDQLAQSIAANLPAQSALSINAAVEQAIDANPRWQDPVLRIYEQYATRAEKDRLYAYFSSLAGRRLAASMPAIAKAANRILLAEQVALVAAVRQQLNAPAASAAAPASASTPGF